MRRLRVVARRHKPEPVGAKGRYLAGRQSEDAKDWHRAAKHYRAAVRARASAPPLWHFRYGRVLERVEGWRSASEAYEAAVKLAEHPPASHVARLAQAYRMQGRFDDADAVLARGTAAHPGNRQLLVGSAEVAMARRDWTEAMLRWQAVDGLGTELPAGILVRMSFGAGQVRDYVAARRYLDRALDADPDHEAALTERANILHRRMGRRVIGQEGDGAEPTLVEGWQTVVTAWERLAEAQGGRLRGRLRDRLYDARQNLIDELAAEGQAAAAGEKVTGLFRALERHGADIPPDFQQVFTDAVVNARSTGGVDATVQRKLIDDAAALPRQALPVRDWLVLYELALWNGLWTVASALRGRAVEAAQVRAATGETSPAWGVRAAIDRADFAEAARLLDVAERQGRQQASLTWLRAHFLLSCGEPEQSRELVRGHLAPWDAPFADYIRGRSVAIVGPAPSGAASGPEIDSFDVIVRCNYRGADRMPDAAVFGSRTDVSYFNETDSLSIDPERTASLVDELDHAVLKSITRADQRGLATRGWLRAFRTSRELVLRTPNSIQNVLLDIHRFEPSKVKVFHANLFLSDEPYFAAYRPDRAGEQTSSLRQKLALGLHDPLSQLTLTRNLWRSGIIEVDTRLEEVLSMTNGEYMMGMAGIYRPLVHRVV